MVTSTINWLPHISGLLGKVYDALSTLCFHRKALSYRVRLTLVKLLVIPHFDYASIVYMNVDLTRGQDLQVDQNTCVRFITKNIPFISTREATFHLKFWRLKLGQIPLASRRHLQLITLFYYIQCKQEPHPCKS